MASRPDPISLGTREILDATHGRWQSILVELGADHKYLTPTHGPCPFCGGKDRYRFIDDGTGRWLCGQCGHGDGFDFIQRMDGTNFAGACRRIKQIQ